MWDGNCVTCSQVIRLVLITFKHHHIFQLVDIVDDAPINKMLPKELLLRVFSYLDVVSLCRSAQVIVRSGYYFC